MVKLILDIPLDIMDWYEKISKANGVTLEHSVVWVLRKYQTEMDDLDRHTTEMEQAAAEPKVCPTCKGTKKVTYGVGGFNDGCGTAGDCPICWVPSKPKRKRSVRKRSKKTKNR